MIRILLADDHTILRDGIRALLSRETDMCVVGEAGNGRQLLELLATTPTDVVLMDINMPVLDGFATMPLLREQFPEVQVLVLSMLDHESYVHRMLRAGAIGYVLKNADSSEIAYAIRTVAGRRPFLCTELGTRIAQPPDGTYAGPGSGGRRGGPSRPPRVIGPGTGGIAADCRGLHQRRNFGEALHQ